MGCDIGLYRDVWIAAIVSSTTRVATRKAAICVRFQGRRVRRVYVTMQITFLTRKSALIYRGSTSESRQPHSQLQWQFRDKSLYSTDRVLLLEHFINGPTPLLTFQKWANNYIDGPILFYEYQQIDNPARLHGKSRVLSIAEYHQCRPLTGYIIGKSLNNDEQHNQSQAALLCFDA